MSKATEKDKIEKPVRRSMKDLIKETAGTTAKKTSSGRKNSKKNEDDDHDIRDDDGTSAPIVEKKKKPEKEYSIEVTKASIKNDLFLSADWNVRSKDDIGSYSKDGENPIHDDLKKAFSGLDIHLVAITEQFTDKGKLDNARTTCRGFSIGGNGEGVTLHGTRILTNGKAFNFNSPFYKWDAEKSESLFEFDPKTDLHTAINVCRAEVIKYLFQHKYKPEKGE